MPAADLVAVHELLSPKAVKFCARAPEERSALEGDTMQVWRVEDSPAAEGAEASYSWHYRVNFVDGRRTGTFDPKIDARVIRDLNELYSDESGDITENIKSKHRLHWLSRPYLKLTYKQQNEIISILNASVYIFDAYADAETRKQALLEFLSVSEPTPNPTDASRDLCQGLKNYLSLEPIKNTAEMFCPSNAVAGGAFDSLGGRIKDFLSDRKCTTRAEMYRFIQFLALASLRDLGVEDNITLGPAPAGTEGLYGEVTWRDLHSHASHEAFLSHIGIPHHEHHEYPEARAPGHEAGAGSGDEEHEPYHHYASRVTSSDIDVILERFEAVVQKMENKVLSSIEGDTLDAETQAVFDTLKASARRWMRDTDYGMQALSAFKDAGNDFIQYEKIQAACVSYPYFIAVESEELTELREALATLRSYSAMRRRIKEEMRWAKAEFVMGWAILGELFAVLQAAWYWSFSPIITMVAVAMPLIQLFARAIVLASFLEQVEWDYLALYIESANAVWAELPALLGQATLGILVWSLLVVGETTLTLAGMSGLLMFGFLAGLTVFLLPIVGVATHLGIRALFDVICNASYYAAEKISEFFASIAEAWENFDYFTAVPEPEPGLEPELEEEPTPEPQQSSGWFSFWPFSRHEEPVEPPTSEADAGWGMFF